MYVAMAEQLCATAELRQRIVLFVQRNSTSQQDCFC